MAVYVKIPAPVDIRERVINPETKATEARTVRTMPLFDIIDWLTNDNHFAKPAKMAKVAAELLAEFEDKAPGSYVKLTTEQYGHVKAVLDDPSAPMNPFVSKQIVPLLDALLEPLSEEQWKKETAASTNGQTASA